MGRYGRDSSRWPSPVTSTRIHRCNHQPDTQAHKFKPQTRFTHFPAIPGHGRPLSCQPHPTPLGTEGCSPSCRCPYGRCLPARTVGYSHVRSPHGCHCRQSPASTLGNRTRKSTGLGGRHPPRKAARMVQGTVKEAGCSGLRTPASWCRAQGRAQAASGAGLRHGHGRTDGRVHLAWHRSVVPAEWSLQKRSLNPPARKALRLPPAVPVIGAGQISFWPITFRFCFSVNRAALRVGTRAARPRADARADWFGSSSRGRPGWSDATAGKVSPELACSKGESDCVRLRALGTGLERAQAPDVSREGPLNDVSDVSPAVQPVRLAESLPPKAVASAGHDQKECFGRHEFLPLAPRLKARTAEKLFGAPSAFHSGASCCCPREQLEKLSHGVVRFFCKGCS